ncbi:TetR/AcrR family transcriptional regulator [Jannaschia pohangensis]|uniref:Transcriptional regulator, TetR family n=1 Tax=Jannaschia pohangensis TaxID=390807 RepID=A0A1I3MCV7_9RHOB|nr:TetR/AcrR family transcriptional regulator [Jannaschia pohangensis]SFI94821.1 transcriptional regulator, TetR family [Jannaschia pohangensis]
MTDPSPSTRDRLLQAGLSLFQEQGFHGTSVAEILTRAKAPKGSLYHHFPDGKSDLARVACRMTSDLMLNIIARAYDPAVDFAEGTARMAEKFARLFERDAHWRACPVQTLLIDGPLDRADGAAMLQTWIDATTVQAERLGQQESDRAARTVWSVLIGSWTLARAQDDPAPLREMTTLLNMPAPTPKEPPR